MTAMRVMTVSVSRLYLRLSLMMFGLLTPVLAQVTTTITPDGSLGTTVIQNGPVHTIEGGTIRGPNQFHSFGRFDVGTGDTARFTGPLSVEHILSRVTGGAASMIDGTLQSDVVGASLYVLNPSGVMFGPNARLDVTGSFYVSTAEIIRLADGGHFDASLGVPSQMTMAAPASFGFLRESPEAIRVESSVLEVPQGESIFIVGGDIDIHGDGTAEFAQSNLSAPQGLVTLVSVASTGDVQRQDANEVPFLDVDTADRLGAVALIDGALIDTSGDRGGAVVIRAGSLFVGGSRVFANTRGDRNGLSPGIDIQVQDDMILTNRSSVTTDALGGGHAGRIRVTAGSLQMDEASRLRSSSLSAGRAGDIWVEVNTIALVNGADLTSSTQGEGAAGDIVLMATASLRLEDSFIGAFTLGDGEAGRITIAASDMILREGDLFTASGGSGRAGDIDIQVARLDIVGGEINSSGFSRGAAGTLMVTATEAVTITAPSLSDDSFAGLSSNGEDKAGRVIVSSPVLRLDGGFISASQIATDGPGGEIVVNVNQLDMIGGAGIGSSLGGQGPTIDITATESIMLRGVVVFRDSVVPSFISSPGREGDGGNIRVRTPDLAMQDGAGIFTTTIGTGRGGDIDIRVDRLDLTGGARITSIAGSAGGSGGDIRIEATEHITISGRGPIGDLTFFSEIGAGTMGDGSSGNVRVTAPIIRLGTDGGIDAITTGAGQGGDIRIEADQLLLDGGFISSSTSNGGPGGTIEIRATESVKLSERGTITAAALANPSADQPTGVLARAGRIRIRAPVIILRNHSGIGTSTEVDADAGAITITADTLQLSEGSLIVSDTTNASGAGGEIILNIGDLTATSKALIGSSSRENTTGKAGAIRIQGLEGEGTQAQSIHLTDAIIETRATTADGGDIEIHISDSLQLRESRIVAEVGGGSGSGGNITINSRSGLLQSSEIRADAFGGPGGNVVIQTDGFIVDVNSQVSASSDQSVDGTVDIQGLVDLSGSLTAIEPDFASTSTLLTNQCARRLQGEGISRFTLAGRDRIPTEPGGLLPSPSGQVAVAAAERQATPLSPRRLHLASTRAAWYRGCER